MYTLLSCFSSFCLLFFHKFIFSWFSCIKSFMIGQKLRKYLFLFKQAELGKEIEEPNTTKLSKLKQNICINATLTKM